MYKRPAIYNIIIFLLIFTVLFSNNLIEIFAAPETTTAELSETTTEAPSDIKNYADEGVELTLNSRAAILIDAVTGTVIYEKNAKERHYPASTTKVLTGYIACSEGNFDDTVTVSQEAIDGMGIGGSSIGLTVGEQVNYKDALYGMMLESANEVCMAISEHLYGTTAAFVDRMNEIAKSIGCEDTHFANPHGFHDDNHYTTCYDMALIAKLAVTNEDFDQIWGTVSYQIPATNLNVSRYLNHSDRMMRSSNPYYYVDLLGGKTGFTDEAGNTLVSYAERDGATLISVVMQADGYDNSYKDSTALLDYGFSVYNNAQTVFNAESYSTTANVVQNYKDKTYQLGTVAIGAARSVEMALPKFISQDSVTVKTNIDENLTAPVNINDIVGTIEVYYGETLLDSVEAIATTEAPALSDKELAKRELKGNLQKYVALPLMILLILFILFLVVIFIQSIISKITGQGKKRRGGKRKKGNKRKHSPQKRKRSSQRKRRSQQKRRRIEE